MARYTPVLVDRFLNYPPHLQANISCGPLMSSSLVLLSHLSLYTTKYVRSKSAQSQQIGNRLSSCVAESIVAVAGDFDKSRKQQRLTVHAIVPMLRGLDFLLHLLLIKDSRGQFTVEPDSIAKQTQDALFPWLALWSRPDPNTKHDECQQSIIQASALLVKIFNHRELNPVRISRTVHKVINECSFPGCKIASGLKGCER